MKPEKKMWAKLSAAMGYGWHAQRHEDSISRGIPDVSFGARQVQGWIELKVLPRWPSLNRIVKLEKFTPQQKAWLINRGQFAGACWFLLCVKKEWLLFHWMNVREIGKLPIRELKSKAALMWIEKEMGQEGFREMLLTRLINPPSVSL